MSMQKKTCLRTRPEHHICRCRSHLFSFVPCCITLHFSKFLYRHVGYRCSGRKNAYRYQSSCCFNLNHFMMYSVRIISIFATRAPITNMTLYTFRSFFTVMLVIGALVAKMLIIRTEYIMKWFNQRSEDLMWTARRLIPIASTSAVHFAKTYEISEFRSQKCL
jgi:hypothetical protein